MFAFVQFFSHCVKINFHAFIQTYITTFILCCYERYLRVSLCLEKQNQMFLRLSYFQSRIKTFWVDSG